jgi:hypothetical protein
MGSWGLNRKDRVHEGLRQKEKNKNSQGGGSWIGIDGAIKKKGGTLGRRVIVDSRDF